MASIPETRPWPTEVRLQKGRRGLQVTFEDGANFTLPAEYLRVESPSAEVKGHGPGQEVTVAGKKNVRILRLAPVGHYALRIIFDDGHDTGLYTWAYLRELGRDEKTRWPAYLEKLAAKKLTR